MLLAAGPPAKGAWGRDSTSPWGTWEGTWRVRMALRTSVTREGPESMSRRRLRSGGVAKGCEGGSQAQAQAGLPAPWPTALSWPSPFLRG